MGKYIRYLMQVIRHKWFVFIECCKIGIPLLGIIHDWTKFLPREFIPYARYFCGEKNAETKRAFDVAWLHHQKANRHHWQYWILQYDNEERYFIQQTVDDSPMILALGTKQLFQAFVLNYEKDDAIYSEVYRRLRDVRDELNRTPVAIEMPDRYVREMIADWIGAGRAYGDRNGNKSDTRQWYNDNRGKMILHENTRRHLDSFFEMGV